MLFKNVIDTPML